VALIYFFPLWWAWKGCNYCLLVSTWVCDVNQFYIPMDQDTGWRRLTVLRWSNNLPISCRHMDTFLWFIDPCVALHNTVSCNLSFKTFNRALMCMSFSIVGLASCTLASLTVRVVCHSCLFSNKCSSHCFICTESSFHTAFAEWQNVGGEGCNSKGTALLMWMTFFLSVPTLVPLVEI
jgi:hypothetical protein